MKNLTTLMRSMTVLLFFVMVGASTAWAQTTHYAERNGIGSATAGTDGVTRCQQADPCDLAAAIAAVTANPNTDGNIIAVRVRNEGAMTRIDEDVTFGTAITLDVWVDGGSADPKGMIAIEGEVDVTAAVTVAEGATLYLEGPVTLNSAVTTALFTGDVQLGGAGDLTLTLGETCPAASTDRGVGGFVVEKLGINGDVDVELTATPCGNPEITITNSLNVKAGDLDMGDVTLSIEPAAAAMTKDDGSVSIAAGAMI